MIQSELVDLIQKLKKQPGKHIWICGGADLVRQCMDAALIDTYYISVIPTISVSYTHLDVYKRQVTYRYGADIFAAHNLCGQFHRI